MDSISRSKNLSSVKKYIVQFYRQLVTNSNLRILLTASSTNKDSVCFVVEEFLKSNLDSASSMSDKTKYSQVIVSSKEKHRYITVPKDTIPNEHRLICRGSLVAPFVHETAPRYFLLAHLLNEKVFNQEGQTFLNAQCTKDGSFTVTGVTSQEINMFLVDVVEKIKAFMDFGSDDLSEEDLSALKYGVLREIGDTVVFPPHDRAIGQLFYGITAEDVAKFKTILANCTLDDIRAASKTLFGMEQETGFVLTCMGTEEDIPESVSEQSKGKDALWEITGQQKVSMEEYILGKNEEEKETQESEDQKPSCSF